MPTEKTTFRRLSVGVRNGTGLSLIETVVLLALIAILIAILLPAISRAREAMRRMECSGKLRQIGLAVENYNSNYECFPPGAFLGRGFAGFSQLVPILPFLGKSNIWNALNCDLQAHDPGNATVARLCLSCFLCPSDITPTGDEGATNYAGNFGSGNWDRIFDGLFQPSLRGPIRHADIDDGTSQTACFSEWVRGRSVGGITRWEPGEPYLGWVYPVSPSPNSRSDFVSTCTNLPLNTPPIYPLGLRWLQVGSTLYNHQLQPGAKSCFIIGSGPHTGDVYSAISAGSRHNGGVNVLFADGTVRFVNQEIDLEVWRALGSRNGAEESQVPF